MNGRLSPTEFARQRRQAADEFERLMWQHLRNRQRVKQKFCREYPLGIYTADFFCAAGKLVVEVDGSSHESAAAKKYDADRDRWLESQGIRVLRFTVERVVNHLAQVLVEIDLALQKNPSPPIPLLPKTSE